MKNRHKVLADAGALFDRVMSNPNDMSAKIILSYRDGGFRVNKEGTRPHPVTDSPGTSQARD